MIIAFVSVLMVGGIAPAYACKCMMPDDAMAQDYYDQADIVLRVKPTEFSKGWNASGPLITFEILETYKTNQELDDTITTKNNPSTAACGNDVQPDTEYVFGFWDLQRQGYTVKNAIGYRMMHSCAQYGVQNYIKNQHQKSKE
jgi:hypothetical protein